MQSNWKRSKWSEKPGSDDTFDAAYLNYQLNSLLNREELVKKHLEQLMFEDSREHYRVSVIDAASAPKSPSTDERLRLHGGRAGVCLLLASGSVSRAGDQGDEKPRNVAPSHTELPR